MRNIALFFYWICTLAALGIAAAAALPATAARSVIVDPQFAYYTDRTAESIVEEITANGIGDVRLVAVNESQIRDDLIDAFRAAGVTVWMLTISNGTYSTKDLPEGWEAWRMKVKKSVDFTYLCLNDPAYRAWKKKALVDALTAHKFTGIDLAEAFLPAYNGPESDAYGCLCDDCAAEFRRMYSQDPPEFVNPESHNYWTKNRTLYEKWMGFRVSTVVNYLDELVNGKDGIRERCPGVKVCTWSLGLDVPDQVTKLREWEALDAAAIVKRVRPDIHLIQTDWPDWIKTDLPPDYALKYKPVADSVRLVALSQRMMLQTDIGSKDNMRRSRQWVLDVEKAAGEIGCESATHYEYHLGDYIYTEQPEVRKAAIEGEVVKLVFNKRLDAVSAANIANYTVTSGTLDYARVDGNVVRLTVSGATLPLTVVVSGLSDDPTRRFYKDRPACQMERSQQVTISGEAVAD